MIDCLLAAMLQVNCFTYRPETSTKGQIIQKLQCLYTITFGKVARFPARHGVG